MDKILTLSVVLSSLCGEMGYARGVLIRVTLAGKKPKRQVEVIVKDPANPSRPIVTGRTALRTGELRVDLPAIQAARIQCKVGLIDVSDDYPVADVIDIDLSAVVLKEAREPRFVVRCEWVMTSCGCCLCEVRYPIDDEPEPVRDQPPLNQQAVGASKPIHNKDVEVRKPESLRWRVGLAPIGFAKFDENIGDPTIPRRIRSSPLLDRQPVAVGNR